MEDEIRGPQERTGTQPGKAGFSWRNSVYIWHQQNLSEVPRHLAQGQCRVMWGQRRVPVVLGGGGPAPGPLEVEDAGIYAPGSSTQGGLHGTDNLEGCQEDSGHCSTRSRTRVQRPVGYMAVPWPPGTGPELVRTRPPRPLIWMINSLQSGTCVLSYAERRENRK